jgi:EAL domain-containing protein (putative c-di-GMP-specific phosphodiesterase class I)
LSYLRRFPLDELKIDRSFINQVHDSKEDAAIVEAIIALAKALDLKIVAEGVETHSQLSFLQQRGCDEIQGFLFSKPLPKDQFISFVTLEQAKTASG